MGNTGAPSTAAVAFPSTDWSAVAHAAASHDPGARAALDRLLTRYIPALRTFLIHERRMDRHVAEDVLQGFVAERILERQLLAQADRARGRLRTFLLACLTRYVLKQARRDRAKKRHPGADRLMGGLEIHSEDRGRAGRRSDSFEVAWARQVIADALARMKEDCEESLRPDLWALFEGRVLLPATDGSAPLSYPRLVEQFGFDSVAHATNALVTAKRMYARHLRAAVAEYAAGAPADVEEELRWLKRVLADH